MTMAVIIARTIIFNVMLNVLKIDRKRHQYLLTSLAKVLSGMLLPL